MKLKPFHVCDIAYRCELYKDIEEDEITGYWNGDVDAWGKLTIKRVDGGPTIYLFRHEITDVCDLTEHVPPADMLREGRY